MTRREPPTRVQDVSYRHEELAQAHPDLFAGWGFSQDGTSAELFYAEDREAEARALAANFVGDGELSVLVPRRNSWFALMERRRAVHDTARDLGIDVIEAVPDPREADGIVLVVSAENLNSDGTVGSPSNWAALTAAGVVKAESVGQPEPRTIAGFAVFTYRGAGFTVLTDVVSAAGHAAAQILSVRRDLYAGAAYSLLNEYHEIWVKADHLDEAKNLLLTSGVDLALIRLTSRSHSLDELTAMVTPLWEAAEHYGLIVTSGGAWAEMDGVVLGMDDPQALETLTPQQRQHLMELGLVGVLEEDVVATSTEGWFPTAEPT